jgi:hypothetical protein
LRKCSTSWKSMRKCPVNWKTLRKISIRLRKCAKSWKSVLKAEKVCQKKRKCVKTCICTSTLSLKKYVKACTRMHKYARVCTSKQKPAQVCTSMEKLAHVCKSKFYDNLFPFFAKRQCVSISLKISENFAQNGAKDCPF